MAKVLFKFGTRAAYDALSTYESNALYFLTDTNELYRGEVPYGVSHYYYYKSTSATQTEESKLAGAIGTKTPVLNDLAVIEDIIGAKDVYVYGIDPADSEKKWIKLTANLRAEDILFADGSTLASKLSNVSISVDGKSIVQDEDGVVSLANYGETYWRWDSDTSAYVEQTVDETHPWKSGLTPRVQVDDEGVAKIAWFEPNPTTAEGVSTNLAALQQDIAALQAQVGKEASGEDPATGLVADIRNLQSRTYFLGNEVVPITVIDNKVKIPYLTDSSDGVVARYLGTEDKATMFLNANGQWSKAKDPRIGNLTYKDNPQSNTVEDYVALAVLDAAGIEWQDINNA